MTKKELQKYAKDELGIEVSMDLKKADMQEVIDKASEEDEEDEEDEEEKTEEKETETEETEEKNLKFGVHGIPVAKVKEVTVYGKPQKKVFLINGTTKMVSPEEEDTKLWE